MSTLKLLAIPSGVIARNGMLIHFLFFILSLIFNFSFTEKYIIQEISREPVILLFHISHTMCYLSQATTDIVLYKPPYIFQ
jgi:hypothetical protein